MRQNEKGVGIKEMSGWLERQNNQEEGGEGMTV